MPFFHISSMLGSLLSHSLSGSPGSGGQIFPQTANKPADQECEEMKSCVKKQKRATEIGGGRLK
jgi:hypothetical protein